MGILLTIQPPYRLFHRPPSRIFHSNGDVPITDERLQIFTYAQHSWLLSSEGSLACHTYYNDDLF